MFPLCSLTLGNNLMSSFYGEVRNIRSFGVIELWCQYFAFGAAGADVTSFPTPEQVHAYAAGDEYRRTESARAGA